MDDTNWDGAFGAEVASESDAALRELASRERAVASDMELAEESLSDRAQLQVLDLQLGAFEDLDWNLLAAESPSRARALWARFMETQEVRNRFAESLRRELEAGRLNKARDEAERLAETGRALAREIDGWSPEVAATLIDYAAAFGVTLDELREVADPRLWKILHRAYQGDLGGDRAAGEGAGSRQAHPIGDELATREWIRRRNAQLG